MKNISKVISGRSAKRRGDIAENILHTEAIRTGWTVIKIPMSCKQISNVKMLRVKSPMDFIFVNGPHVIFADCKTTKAKNYAFSATTEHQVRMLRDIEKHGHMSGYIIQFSTHKKTVFFRGSQLWEMRAGSSLSPENGIIIGDDRIINLSRIFLDSTMTHSEAKIDR